MRHTQTEAKRCHNNNDAKIFLEFVPDRNDSFSVKINRHYKSTVGSLHTACAKLNFCILV